MTCRRGDRQESAWLAICIVMIAASSWKICVWCNLSSFSVRSQEDFLKHMSSLAPFSFYRRNRESKYSWNYLQHIKHVVSCAFTGDIWCTYLRKIPLISHSKGIQFHCVIMNFISTGKSEARPGYLLPGLRLVRLILLMPLEVLTVYTTTIFFFWPCFCSQWKPQWHCSPSSELMLPPQRLRAVPAPLRRLWEMHIHRPQLTATRSESGVKVGSWAQKSVLNKLSRLFLCVLKFVNHCI